MVKERPDLSRVSPEVLEYIESLEAELKIRQSHKEPKKRSLEVETGEIPGEENEPVGISEPSTTLNLITSSANGMVKRSPRHLYLCQRRGGMGIFDLDVRSEDQPATLAIADQNQSLLVFTNLARVFRLSLSKLTESPIHSRGEALTEWLSLEPGERTVSLLPDQASGFVTLVSQKGIVRCLRHHLFGEYLKPGTVLFNTREVGPLAAACWTPGDSDLFIVTRNGAAIRFSEKLIPPKGDVGIRLAASDEIAAVTPVDDESSVFILNGDGKGTLRQMSGFSPNKSPGGSGKLAMKADQIVAAFSITPEEDIFIISQLGKIIRFHAAEVAASEGVVQGVICINLRADQAVAAIKAVPLPHTVY